MSVRWEPYVWKESHPVEPAEVEQLEAAWGIQLPDEYKQLAPLHHGMVPRPNVFDIGKGDDAISCLLTLSSGAHEEEYAISTIHELIKPCVPAGIFPFGMTPGGEYLCFDYRGAPPGQPKVVLVTIEMEIYPIVESFHAFLEGLHELSEGAP